MDTWAEAPFKTTVESILAEIEDTLLAADGVTVSGGEPFDQPDALEALLRGIRLRSQVDILVFSGHSLEWLSPWLSRLDGFIDCIVTDPFEASVGQSLALRGSDNQRMSSLTPLGRNRFGSLDRRLLPGDKALDILFDDERGEVFLAGIPKPGDMRRLVEVLDQHSHSAITTEGRAQFR
jgi:anaerobic ribonucleoside-triphosphate reductase activating protein